MICREFRFNVHLTSYIYPSYKRYFQKTHFIFEICAADSCPAPTQDNERRQASRKAESERKEKEKERMKQEYMKRKEKDKQRTPRLEK